MKATIQNDDPATSLCRSAKAGLLGIIGTFGFGIASLVFFQTGKADLGIATAIPAAASLFVVGRSSTKAEKAANQLFK
jgi:hypothetical protein